MQEHDIEMQETCRRDDETMGRGETQLAEFQKELEENDRTADDIKVKLEERRELSTAEN
jgi:hypothetical protein